MKYYSLQIKLLSLALIPLLLSNTKSKKVSNKDEIYFAYDNSTGNEFDPSHYKITNSKVDNLYPCVEGPLAIIKVTQDEINENGQPKVDADDKLSSIHSDLVTAAKSKDNFGKVENRIWIDCR